MTNQPTRQVADGAAWNGEDLAGGGRRYHWQGPRSEAAGNRATTQPPPPPPPPPDVPAAGIQNASTTDDRSRKRRAFDIGVVVAMLALLFTGVTYVIDLRGQDRADRRQARQDLSQTISDIEALPRCGSRGFSINLQAASKAVPMLPPQGSSTTSARLEFFARTGGARKQTAALMKGW